MFFCAIVEFAMHFEELVGLKSVCELFLVGR